MLALGAIAIALEIVGAKWFKTCSHFLGSCLAASAALLLQRELHQQNGM